MELINELVNAKVRLENYESGQLTLGPLIAKLKELDPSQEISAGWIGSYRGFYEQLAISPEGLPTVGELVVELESCIGKQFTGYKGGEFTMDEKTFVWLADYGDCGDRIVGVDADGWKTITYEG